MDSKNYVLHLFYSALILLLLGRISIAQTYNGAIRGSITDPRGAALPNATVSLTDESIHQTRETKSDGAGFYVFNALKPATYSLHIAAPGFGSADRTNIALGTQDFVTLDVSLSVSSTSDVVQVSAEAPLIDGSTASISTDLDQQRLEDIPVLGRNPYITAKLSGVSSIPAILSSSVLRIRMVRRLLLWQGAQWLQTSMLWMACRSPTPTTGPS